MRAGAVALAVLTLALSGASAARAEFGFRPGAEGFDAAAVNLDGTPDVQAGSHPYEMRVKLGLKTAGQFSDGDLRDLHLALPPGFLATSSAAAECTVAQFHAPRVSPYQESLSGESCSDESQVGVLAVHSSYGGGSTRYFGVFNLVAPAGAPEAIGASPFGVPIVFTVGIRQPDVLTLDLSNLSQALNVGALELTLWGTPAAQPDNGSWNFQHDNERGNCLNEVDPVEHFGEPGRIVLGSPPDSPPSYIAGTCSVGVDPLKAQPPSYLSLPTSCGAPMRWEASATSWQHPAAVEAGALSRDSEGDPLDVAECVESRSVASLHMRTEAAAAATGLVFNLDLDEGTLLNSLGRITSPTETAVMHLPEGLTLNPSLGVGLGVCSPADFALERPGSVAGSGCPSESKIGNVQIGGLLGLGVPLQGSVFLAEPYENPFGTLLAIYVVASDPDRGLFVKTLGKVEPDMRTGRLLVTFEGLPQLHYTRFSLELREGQRAPIVSPPACGDHSALLELRPWSDPGALIQNVSTLHITRGEGGGACPAGAARPFHPGLLAGSLNPQGGAYTPFYLQMTRSDADQEITSYSATFPPGLLGKIAGIPYCPEVAIEAAKGRTGAQELASPSCPAASQIGHTLAGYGVGGVLAYAPGALYLAGPWHGSQLSTVAIDSALVGPFDLGTVVVRSAIRIDPRSAQASLDSAGSDPIPHILKGIPLHLRDIRVYVDRPNFTLNPTSCDPLQTLSALTGAGADTATPADDAAATSADGFKAFNCGALGFRPKLAFSLRGLTRRGRYPSLRATYVPRAADANLRQAAVTLPPSLFLAQEHIDKVCTATRFEAQACPAGSAYGHARAITPLLDEPLEGPVYLRSSTNDVPDLVASLHGRGIAIEVLGRIDTAHGGLRATFEGLPDAPVTKFVITLPGGRRSLLVNAESLCEHPQRAAVRFIAQSNATAAGHPKLTIKCPRHGRPRPR